MSSKKPLVSIIIPTYNRAHLIGDTLDSVLAQTYQNWECIVVDDGSSDDTSKVLEVYCNSDSRIKYFKRPESYKPGGNGARNYGLAVSNGEYINWFDSDDIMVPHKLETDIKCIASGDFDFTVSQTEFFSASGKSPNQYWNKKLWSENPLNDFILKKIGWSINAPLWKGSSLKKKNLAFNENLRSGQDYLFHIQAIALGLRPHVNKETLNYVRKHMNKIEHTITKSKSKANIIEYLLSNSTILGVDNKTKIFLFKQSIQILSNLYKTKNWKKGVGFSIQLIRQGIGFKKTLYLCRLFISGTFFLIFSRGYKFLK